MRGPGRQSPYTIFVILNLVQNPCISDRQGIWGKHRCGFRIKPGMTMKRVCLCIKIVAPHLMRGPGRYSPDTTFAILNLVCPGLRSRIQKSTAIKLHPVTSVLVFGVTHWTRLNILNHIPAPQSFLVFR